MTDTEYLIVPDLSTRQLVKIFKHTRINLSTHCWEYLKPRPDGYGRMRYNGHPELIHRLVYAWMVEPLPRGVGNGKPQLDHLICDNRACFNPEHLKLVPQKANVLRGYGPTAMNARKTHCVNGHLLPTEMNRFSKGAGRRRCITCQRDTEKRRPPRPHRRKAPVTIPVIDH